MRLERNAHGQLVLHADDGIVHAGVLPVRAFPLSAPADGGLSLQGPDGHELVWWPGLSDVPAGARELVDEELARRDFAPAILRIVGVSSFSTPSTWTVETDRGSTSFVLKGEEDIRRLGDAGRLLITSAHGLNFVIGDRFNGLDRASRRLLERFL
jgi:hypothetical protein